MTSSPKSDVRPLRVVAVSQIGGLTDSRSGFASDGLLAAKSASIEAIPRGRAAPQYQQSLLRVRIPVAS
jgi:hypothetical protein